MTETQVPYSWVGGQVEASIVDWGYDERGVPVQLYGAPYMGFLELVNDLGILATLRALDDEGGDDPVSKFYPWSSVLSLHPVEEDL